MFEERVAYGAAIPFPNFHQRRLMDRRLRGGSGADGGSEDRIMRDNDNAIFGDVHVEFQHVHTLLNGVLKSGYGVLRPHRPGTTMAVNFDPVCPVEASYKGETGKA